MRAVMAWNDSNRRKPVHATQAERDATVTELKHIVVLARILATGVENSTLMPYASMYWLRRYMTQKMREMTVTSEPSSTDLTHIDRLIEIRLR